VPAPPKAKEGSPALSSGRALVPGALQRVKAYLVQAQAFFYAAHSLSPESRPLPAYYFLLNLTKGYLTCLRPESTKGRIGHGLSDAFEEKQRYWFSHERSRIQQDGVFRELATRTGDHFCYSASHILKVQSLAPYLVETIEIFKDATGKPPKLMPVSSLDVLTRDREVWLRAEIERGELQQRNLSPESLLNRSRHFRGHFKLVQSDTPSASYESSEPFSYAQRLFDVFPELTDAFERTLIHVDRTRSSPRYFIVQSNRRNLLSQEAVTFLVIHHLSNMVRYRPEQVAKLIGSEWFFLFEAWVPRAIDNVLLTMTSRLIAEETRVQ
jgi:hypothetical protein